MYRVQFSVYVKFYHVSICTGKWDLIVYAKFQSTKKFQPKAKMVEAIFAGQC